MVIVDDQGIVSGLAEIFVDATFQPPLLTPARREAIDGYIRRYDGHKRYHAVAMDREGRKCALEAVADLEPSIQ
jgi:hypothetical protein